MGLIGYLTRRLVPEGARPEDPTVRERCGTASGLTGIALNLLLCAGKFTAGVLSGSLSIVADAFNNLTDACSAAVTLAGFRLARKKPDSGHPFGHGRMEYLAGLFVSVLILLVGLELGRSSVEKIFRPEPVTFSVLSAVILAAAVCVKLWLFGFNRALSKKLSSAALSATAADSLSDAAATAVVLAGLLAGRFSGLPLDGWLGAAVAVFILRSGWLALKDTVDPLLGQPPDPALVKEIQETVLSYPEVVGLHDLIIHDYGPGRRMLSLHAEVPAGSDLMAAHDVIDRIERELRAKYAVEAVIHMDPIVVGDALTDQTRELTARLVRTVHPAAAIHDFRMTSGPLHINLIFDMVLPHNCKLTDEQAKAQISAALRQEDARFFAVVEIDRSDVS